MTEPRNGPTLREYVEKLFQQGWDAHEKLHRDHEIAHGREHQFTEKAVDTAAELARQTKADSNEWREAMKDREIRFATKEGDVLPLKSRIDALEDAEIRRVENESNRRAAEAEEKRNEERRVSRQQWTVGFIVGIVAILVNLVIRLLSGS